MSVPDPYLAATSAQPSPTRYPLASLLTIGALLDLVVAFAVLPAQQIAVSPAESAVYRGSYLAGFVVIELVLVGVWLLFAFLLRRDGVVRRVLALLLGGVNGLRALVYAVQQFGVSTDPDIPAADTGLLVLATVAYVVLWGYVTVVWVLTLLDLVAGGSAD